MWQLVIISLISPDLTKINNRFCADFILIVQFFQLTFMKQFAVILYFVL